MAADSPPDVLAAVQLILDRAEEGRLFDRVADEGGYMSQELNEALAVVRRFFVASD